jgi:hypothetical protein
MDSKNRAVGVLFGLAIMLFVLAIGMLAARIFAGLDISPVIIISQITVGISLMVVALTTSKKTDKLDD